MDHYEYSDTAVIGNPQLATVELGEALIERMADHLADFAGCVTKLQITVDEDARDWPERAY
jgi:creatinine amidohydrolase/Fe(II)-dependent formamide hydrolase-like protein